MVNYLSFCLTCRFAIFIFNGRNPVGVKKLVDETPLVSGGKRTKTLCSQEQSYPDLGFGLKEFGSFGSFMCVIAGLNSWCFMAFSVLHVILGVLSHHFSEVINRLEKQGIAGLVSELFHV
jgi:hypothetical protein